MGTTSTQPLNAVSMTAAITVSTSTLPTVPVDSVKHVSVHASPAAQTLPAAVASTAATISSLIHFYVPTPVPSPLGTTQKTAQAYPFVAHAATPTVCSAHQMGYMPAPGAIPV